MNASPHKLYKHIFQPQSNTAKAAAATRYVHQGIQCEIVVEEDHGEDNSDHLDGEEEV